MRRLKPHNQGARRVVISPRIAGAPGLRRIAARSISCWRKQFSAVWRPAITASFPTSDHVGATAVWIMSALSSNAADCFCFAGSYETTRPGGNAQFCSGNSWGDDCVPGHAVIENRHFLSAYFFAGMCVSQSPTRSWSQKVSDHQIRRFRGSSSREIKRQKSGRHT